MQKVTLKISLSENIYKEAKQILSTAGLTMSEAINAYIYQIILEGREQFIKPAANDNFANDEELTN